MFKRRHWLLLSLTALVLFGSVLGWYSYTDNRDLFDSTVPADLFVISQEPITPIPLELKLDPRKVALGRRLFHDPQLSADNTISCAQCHNLANGGMDGMQHSFGIGGQEGKINTPTIFNSGFNFRLFWDGRAAPLDNQIDNSLTHYHEMDPNWDEVIGKLKHDADYRRDFAAIYLDDTQKSYVSDAITTFVRSLITPNGKFDRFLRGNKDALNDDERAGYELFKDIGCISCHQGINVGGNMYEKLGLFGNYFADRGNVTEVDYGRYNITKIEEQRYEFCVPSLRNVALTAPYFHDGSASSLEKAVAVMGKYQLGEDLSPEEIDKIVKFLNTLTGIYQAEPVE